MPTEYEVFEVDGRELKLSNPGKVYFPQSGWTKGDLARYHVECADAILNQVRERPTMLKRFPGGIEAKVSTRSACRRSARNGSRPRC